jgi:hypothetical protein
MQLRAFLGEIERLKASEFPYTDSSKALEQIQGHFSTSLDYLNELSTDSHPPTVSAACDTACYAMQIYLPLLGFIVSSTSVRNAFEVYAPLLRMARRLLGAETGLIISSEWMFSPFTYIGLQQLSNFVLIGLPATESGNPFLIPLAGHELGHSIWNANSCGMLYRQDTERVVVQEIRGKWKEYNELFPDVKDSELETGIFARQTWVFASVWGMKQAEESFCDFIGLRIFGESYLHAFAYLLSAKQSGQRSVFYPNAVRRVGNLLRAAKQFQLDTSPDYLSMFKDLDGPKDAELRKKFLLSLADAASDSIVPNLIHQVDELISASGLNHRSKELVGKCAASFKVVVPAQKSGGIANVLNAAWMALLDDSFWTDPLHNDQKKDLLTEIVLKSFEVFEIEQLMVG